jgi:AcrR family transcriptional regulator
MFMAPPLTSARAKVTRRSADITRDRILAAALDLFADRSFEGATTREIAAHAGVAQPLLNYHFHSKDELWSASVDGLFGELNRALGARLEGLRGVDDLVVAKLMVREFIYFSAAHPQLHRIITQECKADNARMDWLVDTHIRPLYEMTVSIVSRLVERGAMPAISPTHLYYVVTGAGATMFVLAPECRRLGGFDPLEHDAVEAHADAVTTLLFGSRE